MWVPFCAHIVLLISTQFLSVTCQEKGSLTFVIDTTLSMRDDINQVKRSADKITEAVFQEKASQIQNMVLVTFNDPHAKLEGVIEDRGTFKSKIDSVSVHNLYSNWDCPEMSMTGLLMALENSLPGSFIYVFTDASAKDYKKKAEIQNMCQKKQSQIVFVLTGHCYGLRDPAFKVFSEIASACSGIAFYVGKSDVDKVIDTVTDTIKGKQAPLVVRKVSARQYVEIPFEIDEETEYAIITVSGVDVFLSVHGPGGKQERGMWIRNAKVIKLYVPTPGTYYAKVRGNTETSVYIVGRTDFTFTHGFSERTPNAMSDTGLQPVANAKIYLSIDVNDPKGTVDIESAQILDTNEKVMKTFPLTRMPNGFYLTDPFVVPIHPFKIAVYGKSVHTGKYIQRIGKIVVTPTKQIEPVIRSKKPVVEISEGSSLEVEYGQTVKLACKVSAYPKPEITWTNSYKTTVTSQSAVVDLPYEYISFLTLKVTESDQFSCHAVNSVSPDATSRTISIVVKDPFHVNSASTIEGTKEFEYGGKGTLRCDIKAPVPMTITWSYVQASTGMTIPIVASGRYSISSDGTKLEIYKMDLDMVGSYRCKASLVADPKKNRSFSATIKISGLKKPKVTGVEALKIRKGSSAVFKCEVTGIPEPIITWQFMANTHSTYVLIPGSNNVLRIASVDEYDAGRYKCIASNVVGKDEHVTTLNVLIPSAIITNPDGKIYKAVEEKDHVLKIPCVATGLPKPIITWRVNGVAITPSSKYYIEDESLIIKDPKVSDTQSYRCEAMNEAGTAERIFKAVIFQQPEVNGQSSLTAVKGKSINIECNVIKGVPNPTMTWYFMANGRSDYTLIRGSDNVLRISSVAENDAGRYKCVAQNDVGADQYETTLTVRVPSVLLPSSSVEFTAVEDSDRVLKIPCKATGSPKPVITWRVNGVPITTSAKFSIKDGTLIIRDPKVSDSQSYRCEAKNDDGIAERVFQAVILQKPRITGVTAKTALKGKSNTIECNVVKGVPRPTITWYFMANGRSDYTLIRGSDNVLRISSVAENDAGRYKCVAQNDVGTHQHETTLTVRVPPSVIPSSSVKYKAVEDKDRVLKIPCKATGLPKPIITWRVNGVVISTSSKYFIEDGALIIREPKVTDSQLYRCEAMNDAGIAEGVFQVVILQKPQITGVTAKTIMKGKSDTIVCNVVNGVPTPTITWYFMANGRSDYKPIRGSDNVLRISSVAENDAGRYKCVAQNDVGTDQHETTLTVRVPPSVIPSSSVEYKAVEDKDRVLKIPCKATGMPKPIITWRVNGVPISTSSKYSIQEESLIIREPKVTDSQSYRCEAKNVVGIAEGVFQVVIFQKPQITGIAAKTVVKGKPVVIECNVVKGVPKPSITWQYTPNLHSKYMMISGSDNVLSIPSVDENDAGHYKCVARNEVGYDEHTTALGVQSPALLPPSTSVVYKAVEGKDAVLKIPCEATGSPKPTITWKMNGVTISPSAKYSIEDGALIIKNPKVTDTQSYRCEAKNDAGTAERSFQVIILQQPQVIGSPAKTIVKGKAVVIECNVVKGVPKPSVSWQFMSNAHSKYAAIRGTENVLRISSVDVNDGGNYKCIAHNDAGNDEHVTSLTVQTLPIINTSSSVVYKAVEGSDTILKIPCVASGFPKPNITWRVNGVTISTGPKYSIEDGALIIKDPKVTDTQSYRCEAMNDAGTAEKTFRTLIFQTPKITGERIKRVAISKSVTIACNIVEGVQRPAISWQFKANTRSEYVVISGTDDALGIKSVTKNDAGDYKCVAHNTVGEDYHVTSLIVEYAPSMLPTPSKTYDSVEGDVVLTILCNAVGVPRPEITWEMDGKIITPNAHYEITDQALIIKDPKKSDTKSYKCIAKNHLSTVDTTFKAEVHTRLIDYGKVEEIHLLKGSSKMLECAASHAGQYFRWYKNGNDLKLKEKYLNLQNVEESHDGRYSCRVSDMRSAYTHTYKVMVGYKPTFTNPHKPVVDWTGKEHDHLDCEVKAKPPAEVVWTLNGKVLSDQKSSRLLLSGNWGSYSCQVSNIHGTEQRSFDVKSTECVVSRKAMNDPTMPLILNSEAMWPSLDVTKDYVKIKSGQTVIFSCTDKNAFQTIPSKSNITATCDKQDTFTANGRSYKITDLQCSHEIKPLVTEKHDRCLNENSELMRIGYEVDCLLESYEVCFDVSKDIPLYTRTVMSKSNRGRGTTYKWHNEAGIGHGSDDTKYTCGNTTSCCYSKNQLVNTLDFVDGPAQKSTFIDPLNAVPYWHPCDTDQSPWSDVESMVRSRLDSFDKFVAWTGTHKLETKDGFDIPRYLWKVLNFDDEDTIAIVYINGPSPSDKDILCANKCGSVPWMRKYSKHVYCCDIDDFLHAFELQDTTIGESLPEAFERINARCPRSLAPSV